MPKTLFRRCRVLIAKAAADGVIVDGAVLVDGAEIEAVGPSAEIERLCAGDAGLDIIDCANKIVMPGLVNAHNHTPWGVVNLAYTAAYGSGMNVPADMDFNQVMDQFVMAPMAWFTDRSVHELGLCGMMDQIRHGTTTTADANNHPDGLYRAAVESGLRVVLQPQMLTNLQLDGLDEDGYLDQAEDCLRNYHVGGSDRVTVAVHPSWPWNCTTGLLQRGMELARKYDVQFATHLSEVVIEMETANRVWADKGGCIAHLKEIGLLTERSLFFHGTELTEREVDLLADAGSALVHNPELNAELWARVANVPYWLTTGLTVGLGSDYGQFDMFSAMKLAGLLGRVARPDSAPLDSWPLLDLATMGSARALWLDDKVGTLAPGKKADVITIDLLANSGLVPFCDEPNWIASLLTKQSTRIEVCESMVNGVFLRRDNAFTSLNQAEIIGRAHHWSARFLRDYRQMLAGGVPWSKPVHPLFSRS
jgi:cytosine/adenosine deaminase-related metal-dependent hydrolase